MYVQVACSREQAEQYEFLRLCNKPASPILKKRNKIKPLEENVKVKRCYQKNKKTASALLIMKFMSYLYTQAVRKYIV